MITRRAILALAAATALISCHHAPPPGPDALTIDATPTPQGEILRDAARLLARQGVTLSIKAVQDYDTPNADVAAGGAVLNYFQTGPYLAAWNKAHGTALVAIAGIHVEPLGGYSKRFKLLARLPSHATIAIPEDAANGGRAIRLLAEAGIVTLRDPKALTPGEPDILPSRRVITFRRVPATDLVKALDTVDLAIINTNFALAAGLNPARDALLVEGKNSPYINYLVGLPAAKNDPRVSKLVAVLHSSEVKRFMEKRYKGAVIPAA